MNLTVILTLFNTELLTWRTCCLSTKGRWFLVMWQTDCASTTQFTYIHPHNHTCTNNTVTRVTRCSFLSGIRPISGWPSPAGAVRGNLPIYNSEFKKDQRERLGSRADRTMSHVVFVLKKKEGACRLLQQLHVNPPLPLTTCSASFREWTCKTRH